MADDTVREIDQNFGIPAGLDQTGTKASDDANNDVVFTDETNQIDIQTQTDEDDNSDLDEDGGDDGSTPPNSIQIVQQTVRTAPDGRQVVDIVIEVEDVPGALNYDIRVTKET